MHPTPLGGRYKVISQLGSGGFSQTFLVQDLHLPNHPQCVVKQLVPQAPDSKGLEMARRLFDTEARVLYQLGDHNQIPALLAHFEEKQEFYLAQEYIDGIQLSQQLKEGHPWPEAKVAILLQEILEVLTFIHQRQVIHRDIKPSNLIRRYRDGRVVLIDFGAVKQVSTQQVDPETGLTNLTIAIGTQGYMPNEQMAGKPRFSSDVYAVGMIGIRALTGIHPKKFGEDPQTSEIAWRAYAPWVSPEFAAILDRMVRYDFRDRYPTAIEALEALQTLNIDLRDELTWSQPLLQTESAEAVDLPIGTLLPESTRSEISFDYTTPTVLAPSMGAVETQSTAALDLPASTNPSQPLNTLAFEEMVLPSDNLLAWAQLDDKTVQEVQLQPTQRRWLPPLLMTTGAVTLGATLIGLWLNFLPPSLSDWTLQGSAEEATPFYPIDLAQFSTEMPLLPSDRANQLIEKADRLRQAKQYQEALSAYNKAIKLKSDAAAAYWGRCDSLNALERPEQAIVACNDALAFDPNYPEALLGKGNAFEQQGRLLEALRLYEEASYLKPWLTQAWIAQGRVMQQFGRSAEAIPVLDQAIALDRNSAEAWSVRGEALWNLGRYNQAIASLDKALLIDPNYADAVELRQKAREDLGR